MSKVIAIVLTVFAIGYIVSAIITVPLVIWATIEDEREQGIYREGDRLGLLGRAILIALIISFMWIFTLPLYVLMLAEKIAGRGEDD